MHRTTNCRKLDGHMIEIKELFYSRSERLIFEGINLELKERRIAIVGANGSGKSTFVRLLNGLLKPDKGRVIVDGFDTSVDGKEVRRRVGVVFQNPDNQIVFPVVEEDLAFGLKNLKIPKDQIEKKIVDILERYDLLEYRKHPSHHLSGGQKQLLAISGVLIMEPSYLVLDEPTTLLDIRNKRRVEEAIRDLAQTALVVSHDLDFLMEFERVIAFENGKVVIDDVPSRALKKYLESMQ